MQTARHLYLYVMAGIGLAVATFGLVQLLALVFDRIGAFGGSVISIEGAGGDRDRLSLSLSMIAVGTPVWFSHWWFAERGTRHGLAGAAAERSAPLRALYLGLVPFIAGLAMFSASAAIQTLIRQVAGAPLEYDGTFSDPAAIAVVGGVVWGYHGWIRAGDERAGELRGPAAWRPRLARYALAFIAGLMLCFGAAELIDVLLRALVGRGDIVSGEAWWVARVASGVGQLAVGAAAWGGLWLISTRLLAGDDWRAASERASAVRVVYLALGIVVGAAATLLAAGGGLAALLRWALGIADSSDPARLVEDVVAPSIAYLAFTLAWWFNRSRLLGEAARTGDETTVGAARRRANFLAAAVGIAVAGAGSAWILGLLLDIVLGGARTIVAGRDVWGAELSQYAAWAIVGTPLWLWQWAAALRRRSAAPDVEATSTERRVYLYLVIAGALTSSIAAAALIVYRTFGIVLGARVPESPISDLSTPIGIVIVAAVGVVYHALALRSDVRLRATLVAAPAAEAGPTGGAAGLALAAEAADTAPTGPAAGAVQVAIIVTGPPGADLEAAVETLRHHLPAGYGIRRTTEKPSDQ
jgi:hypothetical protein